MIAHNGDSTGDEERRRSGVKLSRLSCLACLLAVVTAIIHIEFALENDLWGDELQITEVLTVVFWLAGLVLSIAGICKEAAEGWLGIAGFLAAPFAVYLWLFLVYELN